MVETSSGPKSTKISRDDFLNFYLLQSACIDDDNFFEVMIKNCWGIDKPLSKQRR